jgi:hypothetical protein
MFDPAALGTLRIGLDGDPDPARRHRNPRPAAPARHLLADSRAAIATVLRRTADLLEPRPVRGTAG